MLLQNKIAIITGAATGIGYETAKAFLEEGAKIVIVDLTEEGVNQAVNNLKTLGDVFGVVANVSIKADVEKMVQETINRYQSIDILVNNAGITRDMLLSRMDESQWDQVIAVNLKGVFLCTQAVLKPMIAKRAGVILNASSVVGLYGNIGQTNYAATKSGVIGMTKTWAKELGRKNIRVNAVAPGFIQTPMTDQLSESVLEGAKEKAALKRLGTARDVANAYVFLASEKAAFITGETLSIDGGLVL